MAKIYTVSAVPATEYISGVFSREQDPLSPGNKITTVLIMLKTDAPDNGPAPQFVNRRYILETGRFVDKNNAPLSLPFGTIAQFKQNLAFLRDQGVLDEGL